jgi:hypothetical protein
VKAFMKWANKGKRARLFEFKTLDPIVGDALNRCAYEGDLDSARARAHLGGRRFAGASRRARLDHRGGQDPGC